MSSADRCQVLAIITGGLWYATENVGLAYITMALLWFAVINLTSDIRAARRKDI